MLEHTNNYFLWIIDFLAAKNTVLNLVENAVRLESCEVAESYDENKTRRRRWRVMDHQKVA